MKNNRLQTSESGFSLIELLIAIVIFSVITGAAFQLLNNSLKIAGTSNQQTEAQQNLRISQEYLTRDLYNTADGLRGLKPLIQRTFVSNYLTKDIVEYPNVGGNAHPLKTAGFVPLRMINADDDSAADIAVLGTPPGTTVLTGSDRLTVLLTPDIGSQFADVQAMGVKTSDNKIIYRSSDAASEMFVTATDGNLISAGEIYLLVNGESSATESGSGFVAVTQVADRPGGDKIVSFGATNDYGLNSGTVAKIVPSNTDKVYIKRVWITHYFVDNNNRLIRRIFGLRDQTAAQPFTDNIIAEHIPELEFRHILREVYIHPSNPRHPRNGEPLPPEFVNNFTDNIAAEKQLEKQEAVRQVEVSIKAETARGINGGVRRGEVATSTVVSPRNLQFRESLEP